MGEAGDAAVFRRIAVYFGVLNPSGKMSLDYLAEGAANMIWRVRFSSDSNLAEHDNKIALRMRKDLPHTVPNTITVQQFEEQIAPLFLFDPSLLLPLQLCELSKSTAEDLNRQLHVLEEEDKRPAHRRNVYQPTYEEEPYAVIMPNLFAGEGRTVEFKPKWLNQSPSAPKDAQRCRTCALNAMRRHRGVAQGRGDSGFCPFDVLSSHEDILSAALRRIWKDEQSLPAFIASFKEKVQPALRELQKLQRMHNQVGLQDFLNPEGKDFSIAMALRDCSVFLKVVVADESSAVDIKMVKLLDLDLKDAGGGKLAKWANMEREMIEGGWYSNARTSEIQCAMTFQ